MSGIHPKDFHDTFIKNLREQCLKEKKNADYFKSNMEYQKVRVSYFQGLYSDTYEELQIEKESHKADIETLDKYHEALEEIRETAKSISSFTACDEKKLQQIQKKISEVFNEVD